MNQLVTDIKGILRHARQKAYKAVNQEMIKAYWKMGQRIVEEEQNGQATAEYGKSLLKNLSKELTGEFGNGFSLANLKKFRKFYFTFPEFEKSYTLSSFLSWSHYSLIMRVKDINARNYYLTEAAENQWSVRQTERQIKTRTYQRLLSTQKAVKSKEIVKKSLNETLGFIKDPYLFEFMAFPEGYQASESDLEHLLVADLQKFLLELGKGFSFVGRQLRISTETTHYYIDLVFYNYILKCFVIIDLKTGKLTHQDVGQADMYVRLFDDLKRGKDDNPTIGIILCADKDETMVKYSILEEHRQLFASTYRTYLPTEEELIQEIEYVRLLSQKNKEAAAEV